MNIRLRELALTTDEILRELIAESLPQVLGEGCQRIGDDLPFEGRHLLCLDAAGRPAVVAWDGRDAGRALLAGLAVIEGLSANRGLLYRLCPALFHGHAPHGAAFRSEDLRLVVLAPRALPAAAYLQQAFPALSARTFRLLEVDGRIGLLLESAPAGTEPAPVAVDTAPPPAPFRADAPGTPVLSGAEAHHFETR